MVNADTVRIVAAEKIDVPVIHGMIEALADHLDLSHELIATEEDLHQALFGARPKAEVVIGYVNEQPAGFALFYNNYSTFRGRCGVHLEDLFVWPQWRGHGLGRRLLAYLAALTLKRGCGRLEWWVLAEDTNAIGFYEAIGATAKGEWTIYRLRGNDLHALASEHDAPY
jgi:GNAT superfamily N-acetyltransferase